MENSHKNLVLRSPFFDLADEMIYVRARFHKRMKLGIRVVISILSNLCAKRKVSWSK